MLVRTALDAFGRLDVAFANAGCGGPRGFLDGEPDDWKQMILTNVELETTPVASG